MAHPVKDVEECLFAAAKGRGPFLRRMGIVLRRSIDEVVDTPRTRRFFLSDIEKTEKTYLGTKVEILFRNEFAFEKGRKLDLKIGSFEVDVKHSIGRNWTIPTEAIDEICLLISEDDKRATFRMGLLQVKSTFLNTGQNKDAKKTLSDLGRRNIHWITEEHGYPENVFYRFTPTELTWLTDPAGGAERLYRFFSLREREPVSRYAIESLAAQKDPMKRIRKNGGARDLAHPQGLYILTGRQNRALAKELGIDDLSTDEIVSVRPRNKRDTELLKKAFPD